MAASSSGSRRHERHFRELSEETGLVGEIEGLAAVVDWSGRVPRPGDGVEVDHHGIQIVYRVRVTGGDLRDELDGSTDAARWVTPAEAEGMPLVDLALEGMRLARDDDASGGA